MTAMELAIKNNLGEDIGHYLGFMDKVPGEERETIMTSIKHSIFSYKANVFVWESAKKSDAPKRVKDIKRQLKAEHKKRLDRAVAFLADITVPVSSLLDDKNISINAKQEIFNYIVKLRSQEKEFIIEQEVDKISPNQPNKKEIENLIIEIHKKYNIPKLSDNLRELLPQI